MEREQTFREDPSKDLYGIDKEVSLQSVNFAAAENQYINERSEKESRKERY
ncbi:hypothetical protein [Cytobacillus sp. NCCP-133]|uniref:hypothetical protein n=1 Tax=Cytobacillus sp. NCCP-133 TaxID=766848 RepID=UPI002230C19D|nr:hypothetical protein [Cytobacillus sp. NCCP-133]GLB59418.1 hypothetical protein NCCP133_15510 [Cytobacillus sp. NCCP-133]